MDESESIDIIELAKPTGVLEHRLKFIISIKYFEFLITNFYGKRKYFGYILSSFHATRELSLNNTNGNTKE